MYYSYYLLSFIAGIALTTQVALNGKLLSGLSSPILTSTVSFAVGTLGLIITYFTTVYWGIQDIPAVQAVGKLSWWMWTGGLLGAFYIVTSIIASPKIGFANMFSLVIAGQIIFAIVLDHLGILGMVHPVSPARFLGIILLITGVYLIQTN